MEQAYRRQGIATALASRLLLDCQAKRIEPHWDAVNIESCELAEEPRYVHCGSYLAYGLTIEEKQNERFS